MLQVNRLNHYINVATILFLYSHTLPYMDHFDIVQLLPYLYIFIAFDVCRRGNGLLMSASDRTPTSSNVARQGERTAESWSLTDEGLFPAKVGISSL